MSVSDKAQELAQALLDLGESKFINSFSITRNGQSTDEEVIVWVIKSQKSENEKLKESLKRYIPSASGTICPTCAGTGRISR